MVKDVSTFDQSGNIFPDAPNKTEHNNEADAKRTTTIGLVSGDTYVPIKVSRDGFSVANFCLEVNKGGVDKHSAFRVVGVIPSIDTADGFSDVWGGKSLPTGPAVKYVVPTEARIHNIVSSDVADVGTVLSSGTVDSSTLNTMTDLSATFVSDGVSVGNLCLDDTRSLVGRVSAVTETVITVIAWFSPIDGLRTDIPDNGDSYRIVTPGSTGASMIYIYGLDSNFLESEEFVILDGTTPVSSTKSYTRINRMLALGTGSAQGLVGTATATAQTDGTITSAIIGGENISLQAIYTVPANKDGFINNWNGSLANKQAGVAILRIRFGPISGNSFVEDIVVVTSTGTNSFSRNLCLTRIPGGIDVVIEADVDTNNMSISAGFDLILVDVS